jgi:flagellin
MSFTRIGANITALTSLNELLKVNNTIGKSLIRLSSGKRINSVGDDAAGFSLARGLEARRRSLQQALANVGTAKNVLGIAEGGYLAISDLLQIIKEKTVQAADDSFNILQRQAIQGQIDALVLEIDQIVAENQFQGTFLIDGSFTGSKFQTGAAAGDVFTVTLSNAGAVSLGVDALVVTDATTASAAIAAVDTAIDNLNNAAQTVGETLLRLSSKEGTLSVAITNTEAARSRIEDADFALEQATLVRNQIIQQTAFSAFAQANAAPQLVLSLFR